MAPPKGNQYAAGCETSGRPCKYNKEEEFKALLEWSKTDDALVFRMFPCMRGYSHDSLERWALENDEFCDIYNTAKELVGARRELRLLLADSPSPFQRYATYYDKKLHAHEKADKEHEAALRKESNETPNKVVFEVNYSNANNQIEVLPKALSDESSRSS